MAMFRAFKPSGMEKIARSMGYQGNMQGFQSFLSQDPMRQQQMQNFTNQAIQMANGGMVQKPDDYDAFSKSKYFQNAANYTGPQTRDMYQSKYGLGTYGSGTVGKMYDKAYEDFKKNQAIQVGQEYKNQLEADPRFTAFQEYQKEMQDKFQADPRMKTYMEFQDRLRQQRTPQNIQEATIQRMGQPGLPPGGVVQAAPTVSEMGQYVQPQVGTLTGGVSVPTTTAGVAQASPIQEKAATTMEAAQAAPAVCAALEATQAAQGTVDPRAQVTAAQQTASSVGNLTAAQGNAILIDNPVQRNIQAGELISGAANAQTAAQFTEQVEAAQATPSQQATVQGQLAQLTANFDASNPPAWAAGALRNATAQMAARGLGASSLAGQAIVQATIEAALPIAQADAQITAQFETQNLSNRQQRAMLAAQQRATFIGQEFDQAFQARVQNSARIGDIANQNFTAEQQVQLENSRAANTMNLNNLSNRQALVIAEASALANMDLSNINNRQAAAVQNAQSFLQMDMANLSNQQQTDLFAAQQRIQSLFTDQAAQNAALQFNASSQNQVDQFFSNLASQVSQFNATQSNAQAQFNAGQVNTVERFNAELNNQRDQFNAQNQSVIAQSNAAWRRQLATADTAAVNRANEINAAALLDISNTAYSNLWQYYEDTMEWAWTSAESAEDRAVQMAIAALQADASKDLQKMKNDYQSSAGIGKLIGAFLNSDQGSVGDSIFNSITSWF